MSIAVVIIACNEEHHIVEAIKSAKQITDEIIVVDSGSKDATVKLAEQNGAEVIFRAWDDDFAAQRNFAAEKIEAKYIFHLDADERITETLAASVKAALKIDGQKVFAFYRENISFGKKFRYGMFKADKVKRLYPRESATWQGKVHESLQSDLPVVLLKGTLLHYSYVSWEHYLDKLNKYTTIWAQEAFAKGKRTSLSSSLLHAIFAFIKNAFVNLGVLDGLFGLIVCCFNFMYTLAKYVKLYRLQNK